MKNKIVCIFVMTLLVTSIVLPVLGDDDTSSSIIKISINRDLYSSEEEIAITVKNVGKDTAEFFEFPKIEIFDEQGSKVFPDYTKQGEWFLEPGESEIYVWDQKNLKGSTVLAGKYEVADVNDLTAVLVPIYDMGYVILVAGSDYDSRCDSATKEIYDDLISMGYTADRIYFLNSLDPFDSRVDADATEAKLENAIKVWAASRARWYKPLYIVLFDHGGGPSYGSSCCGTAFRFVLEGSDRLYPADLRDWIDDLYASTNAKIHVWDMMCHAGGFISDISRDDNVIITSTVGDLHTAGLPSSDTSPYEEYFTKYFWPKVECGWTWLEAFNYGAYHAESGSWKNICQLDDNGDGVGHGVYDDTGTTSSNIIYSGSLPHHNDGDYADNIYMGAIRIRCGIAVIDWDTVIAARWYLFKDDTMADTIPLWVVLDSEVPISSVKAHMLDPDWDAEGCGCFDDIPSKSFEMSEEGNTGKWLVDIPIEEFQEYQSNEFTFSITAEGKEGESAFPIHTRVGFGRKPMDSEQPFVDVENPRNGEIVSGVLDIKGLASDNFELGKVELLFDNQRLDSFSPQDASHYRFETSLDLIEYEEGLHTIKIKVNDKSGNELVKNVYVMVVGAPEKPELEGDSRIKVGNEAYFFASTYDPQGDDIWYMFDWGDGTYSEWMGPFDSGDDCEEYHVWKQQGNYMVRVKARDVYGKTSDWSNPLSVSCAKNKVFNQWIVQFLERFFVDYPDLFTILKQIISIN